MRRLSTRILWEFLKSPTLTWFVDTKTTEPYTFVLYTKFIGVCLQYPTKKFSSLSSRLFSKGPLEKTTYHLRPSALNVIVVTKVVAGVTFFVCQVVRSIVVRILPLFHFKDPNKYKHPKYWTKNQVTNSCKFRMNTVDGHDFLNS